MNKPAKFTPNDEMIKAAEYVLIHMVIVEKITGIVVSFEKYVLAEMKPKIADEFIDAGVNKSDSDTVILDPKNSYLMSENDFMKYNAICQNKWAELGFKIEGEGTCPKLVAENELRLLQNKLFDVLEPLSGVSAVHINCGKFEDRNKYLDLSLKMLANYVDSKRSDSCLRMIAFKKGIPL